MFTSFLYCLCIITTLPFCNAQKTQRLIYKPANDPTGEKQYYLGVMFEFDDRRKEAIQWYLTSAKLGFVHAQTHLGNIYRDGRIVKKSNKKALKWFTAAALQKDNDALFSLGRMHELGTSATPKSFKQALKLYKKAAKQGHAASQYNLAAMYSRGDGVIANNKIAEKYQVPKNWWYHVPHGFAARTMFCRPSHDLRPAGHHATNHFVRHWTACHWYHSSFAQQR
jgi:TPR repeat protein